MTVAVELADTQERSIGGVDRSNERLVVRPQGRLTSWPSSPSKHREMQAGRDLSYCSPGSREHHLPGLGGVSELWTSADAVTLTVAGEVDALDEHALLDIMAGAILTAANHINVNFAEAGFVGIAPLRAADRVRRYLARHRGSLTVTALPPQLEAVWCALGSTTVVDLSNERTIPCP